MRMYLDVDETINAQMPFGWGRLENRRVLLPGSDFKNGIRVRWAPKLIDEFRQLEGAEPIWLTSWGQWAPKFGEAIDYAQDAPVLVTEYDDQEETIIWKFQAVKTQHGRADEFIWIDNELTDNDRHYFYNALLITPNPRTGISPSQMQEVRDYLAREEAQ